MGPGKAIYDKTQKVIPGDDHNPLHNLLQFRVIARWIGNLKGVYIDSVVLKPLVR